MIAGRNKVRMYEEKGALAIALVLLIHCVGVQCVGMPLQVTPSGPQGGAPS